LQLDFGQSLKYGKPAGILFQERFPNTAALAGVVLLVAFPLGLLLGILSGLRPLSVLDRLISVLSFATVAVPSFWLGLTLMIVFAIWMGILPTSGFGGIANWRYYILPGATLAARPIGRVAQLARASLVDEMGKQYVTVARSKGLAESRIIVVHALKNAMNPVITLGAAEVRVLLGGSIVAETIFGWPGLGSLLMEAITGRDLCVVETCVVAIGVIVIFVNIAVDLLYACSDPRIVYT
jgi:ABC-type dipeptide/oligopeptide/nickel transport system permease component